MYLFVFFYFKVLLVYENNHVRDLQLQVRSLESILRRYSHKKGLVYDKIELDNCTFVSLGLPAPVTESLHSARNNSCSQIPQLRHLVGEASYIVTILTPDLAQLADTDLNLVPRAFKLSLLVLRHVLCLEYRDLLFTEQLGEDSESQNKEEEHLQKLVDAMEDYNFDR